MVNKQLYTNKKVGVTIGKGGHVCFTLKGAIDYYKIAITTALRNLTNESTLMLCEIE